jgi:hypothetical protein
MTSSNLFDWTGLDSRERHDSQSRETKYGMSPKEIETNIDSAGEDQQQFTRLTENRDSREYQVSSSSSWLAKRNLHC